MKENQYRIELRKVLDEISAEAIKRLNATMRIVPAKTQSIELMIFPGQDSDGTFGLRVSLSGPDLYVLNKAIEESADIITVRQTSAGFEPKVPMPDPLDSGFEVNDILSDVVAEWLSAIWIQVDTDNNNVPITIVADEAYGSTLPIRLK